jgi:threonine synthase
MNLCPVDGRPVEIVLDLERLEGVRGALGWWNPARSNMWRFGGLLPLDIDDPADRPHIVSLGEGHTPELAYDHPLAERVGCRLWVKDEGRHHSGGYGANPTLSFKDRGMAMTASLARAAGLSRLAIPTQGNAGDALATYALAAGLDATIVMSPDTDRPVLGNVAALAAMHPDQIHLELVPGTIVDCGRRVREVHVPSGVFNVATFQEPGWRIEGKKTLGLELAEPKTAGEAPGRWQLPDVIVYPTGGGTGILGMAKAFDELEALGLIASDRPRMICVQSCATDPLYRAFQAGAPDIEPRPAGRTLATGLNVAQNVGHMHVLQIVRETGGAVLTVSDEQILATIRDEWQRRRFAWSPEGAATLAALPALADMDAIRPNDRVVLVNTASPEKYLPTIREALDGGL